jgi:hypothetical protein
VSRGPGAVSEGQVPERRLDRGRAEVYAAELMAFDGTELEDLAEFESLLALAAEVSTMSWWPHGPVEVVPARRDARSSTTRSSSAPDGSRLVVVRLADPQLTPATLVHELAHVLAGVGAGHGPRYRRAHVDIATAAFGAERGRWLADAYSSAGLGLGERSWPVPPEPGRSQPIAL